MSGRKALIKLKPIKGKDNKPWIILGYSILLTILSLIVLSLFDSIATDFVGNGSTKNLVLTIYSLNLLAWIYSTFTFYKALKKRLTFLVPFLLTLVTSCFFIMLVYVVATMDLK